MQIFRSDKYSHWDGDEVEVELVPDAEHGSSAPQHWQDGNGGANVGAETNSVGGNGGPRRGRTESDTLEGGPPVGLKPGAFRAGWEQVRQHPKRAWGVIGGAAAALLVVAMLAVKLEWPGNGQLTSSPRSACSYSGILLPPELMRAEEYNTTLHLEWRHYLSQRGRPAPSDFGAESAVRLRMMRATQCLIMHAQGLNFSEVHVTVNDGDQKCLCGSGDGCPNTSCDNVIRPAQRVPGAWHPGMHGMVIVDIDGQVEQGDAVVLHTVYVGTMGTHQNGLYRSETFRYGQEHSHLISTQFKESYARQVLPCLDEPAYRANFNLAAEVPPPMSTLSTMPEIGSEDTAKGLKLVTFQTTPPIPPYLLALCSGRLKGKVKKTATGMGVGVWAPPSLEEVGEVDVALDVATKAYEFYAKYTGVKLPLPKLDMVAVPGRRYAEPHWGLALFDERRLLYNQESEGAYDMFLAANVVCHHLAQQWFGGYVSPATWAELGVADGLSGLVAYQCMEDALPEMNGRALFQLATSPMGQAIGPHEGPQTQALQIDSDPLASPLVPEIGVSPPPALGISVGAAFFAMIQNYGDGVTPGGFQAGLQLYLQRHALGNGTMAAAVQAIAEAVLSRGAQARLPAPLCLPHCLQTRVAGQDGTPSNADVDAAMALMTPYFTTGNYPEVSAEQDRGRGTEVHFSQSRFEAWAAPPGAVPPKPAPPHWWAPLAVGTFDAADPKRGEPPVQFVELEQPEHTISLPDDQEELLSSQSWLVKRGGVGLFRARYDDAQTAVLVDTLRSLTVEFDESQKITEASLERLLDANALLDDAFAAALATDAYRWEAALQLAEAAAQSQAVLTGFGQYLVLLPVVRGLAALRLRLRDNETCMTSLNAFQVKLLATPADAALAYDAKYGDQDAFLMKLAEANVLTAAAQAGDHVIADTLCGLYANNTLEHHKGHLSGGVDIDVRGAAYMTAVAQPPGCQGDAEQTLFVDEHHWLFIQDEREGLRYVYAMPASRNTTDLDIVLHMLFGIKSQFPQKRAAQEDALQALHLVAANDVGGPVAWDFVTSEWASLTYEHGYSVMHTLGNLPLPSTQQQLDKVTAFFAPGGIGQVVPQPVKDRLLGRLAAEVAWVGKVELGLCTFLAAHNGN